MPLRRPNSALRRRRQRNGSRHEPRDELSGWADQRKNVTLLRPFEIDERRKQSSVPTPIQVPAAAAIRAVLVTGGTGYLGQALIPALLARGHRVRALVRPGSAARLPARVEVVTSDPLQADSVNVALAGVETLVHLVGVPKPSPRRS